MVVHHHQKAPVEGPILASEHRCHRRLHVVVDPAQRHPAEKLEPLDMGVEHHLLRLAWVNPPKCHARPAQPHVGDLHPHRLAGDLEVLMAPVELVGLPGAKLSGIYNWPGSTSAPPRRSRFQRAA
jgi:hypothetical protein